MQHVLITGANRGLGFEFTRQYLVNGDRVFAACREPDRATELKRLLPEFPKRLSILQMDVADSTSIQAAHLVVARDTTVLDLLINNAGVYSSRGSASPGESLGALSFDDALRVLRTNSIGPLMVSQQFLELLVASEKGRIVNITSGYGSVSNNTSGFPYYYSASKAALNQLTRSIAADVHKRNVIAVVFDPGWVATDMGGPGAPVSPQDAVANLIDAIERLNAKDNGQFLNRFGERQNW